MKKKVILGLVVLLATMPSAKADDVSNCPHGFDTNHNLTTGEVTNTCLPYHEPLPVIPTSPSPISNIDEQGNIMVTAENIIHPAPQILADTTTAIVSLETSTLQSEIASTFSWDSFWRQFDVWFRSWFVSFMMNWSK
jgi:hypothetical protein